MSELEKRLSEDLAEVAWKDLRIHLQRDAIILVAAELDLLATAKAVVEDDKTRVEALIAGGQLRKPNAEQIAAWETQLDKPFAMLIAQPYILVQDVNHA